MLLLILAFTSRSAILFHNSSKSNIILRIEANKNREDLLNSRQKLSLHIEKTPLGFIEWDINFQVSEWNHSAELIFGYTKKEALGHHAAGPDLGPGRAGHRLSALRQGLQERGG